jgi:hypothetical protein
VVGVPHDKVRIGMPVRLEFQRYDEELELPVFRAEEGSGGDGVTGDSAARSPASFAGRSGGGS